VSTLQADPVSVEARGPSPMRRRRALVPYALAAPGVAWLFALLLAPFALMLYTSLQSGNAALGDFRLTWAFSNYSDAFSTYQVEFVRSAIYAGLAALTAVALAFPAVYWIAFYGGRYRSSLLALLLLPFFVSFVIRTAQWKFLLGDEGMIVGPLKWLGVVGEGFHVLATPFAVVAGITYNFLPFAALPIYVALARIDVRLLEAARDLYAGRTATFTKVVLPLSMPGLFAALILTFVPAMGDYVNAAVLGGPGTTMLGNVIQSKFLIRQDYPSAAALAAILMLAMLVVSMVAGRFMDTETAVISDVAFSEGGTKRRGRRPREHRRRRGPVLLPIYTVLVMLYLTAPILVMILYGFNNVPNDRNSPHFFGVTFEWYRNAFEIAGLTEALQNSLVIAGLSAVVATALGTLLGLALGRYRFRGHRWILGLLLLAIAVPEVVLGSSLLSMFVWVNDVKPLGYELPLGMRTMFLSHCAFSIAFVTLIVRAQVQGLDDTLEQAAEDLYARPVGAFWHITLPAIVPSILAGLMLAFVLSLDDFVITNFVSGDIDTFPLWVFGATRVGLPPQVNVLGTLLFVGGVLLAATRAGVVRFRRVETVPPRSVQGVDR
jgi:spermidine/putrescine transport system permease protein